MDEKRSLADSVDMVQEPYLGNRTMEEIMLGQKDGEKQFVTHSKLIVIPNELSLRLLLFMSVICVGVRVSLLTV